MVDLKAKVILNQKGEEAYISVKQLMVTLKWTANVDLDLMAFYQTKDGRDGGVFSDNFPGGNLGSLNEFPFIQLSGDEGVGAKGGDNEEVLRVTKLDDLAALYICTLNYTDASQKKDSSFSQYDGGITVIDDRGESIGVPLNSTTPGQVAVIAKIDNSSPMGAKLINENSIIDLGTFVNSIPGAKLLVA
ncbi:hypothetical protein [Gloeocapsa sp. PCC 73106]|uniref:hypothetical protein n=1 Tax=Gloeocapsa sp. PCC 73106 TaxID=102232 RepID=UPI0002AC8D03|nr:hypothetical protein [Gloeocapsa sp. PCC 73106]ELR98647.1 hypothetical protein GLO73106DRAFT_00024840 [Gloeocapsa sp. PCC 73106]